MSIRRHIPNAITCMNLVAGVASIVLALQLGELRLAACCIALAAIFDFFDGLVARALGVTSPIGKDLDSLADVVSFGVAPSLLLYVGLGDRGMCALGHLRGEWLLIARLLPCTLIAVFAALRLAKFNNDTRQSLSFIGLPVPANALFWIGYTLSLPSISVWMEQLGLGTRGVMALSYGLVWVLAWLMVSEVPMFSFKLKDGFSLQGMKLQLALLVGSLVLSIFLGWLGVSLSVLLYVALSALGKQKASL